jgi:hypothetical protein
MSMKSGFAWRAGLSAGALIASRWLDRAARPRLAPPRRPDACISWSNARPLHPNHTYQHEKHLAILEPLSL